MTVGSSTNVPRAVAKLILARTADRSPRLVYSVKTFASHPAQSVPHDRSPGGGKKLSPQ
jgi:hypothetical protein